MRAPPDPHVIEKFVTVGVAVMEKSALLNGARRVLAVGP
jgi:hypothetical protein